VFSILIIFKINKKAEFLALPLKKYQIDIFTQFVFIKIDCGDKYLNFSLYIGQFVVLS